MEQFKKQIKMKTNYKKIILLVLLFNLVGWYNILKAQVIAAGGWHSLVVCSDSTVKAFGENASGELGDSTTTDRNTPVQVSGLTGIISVSGGGDQLEAHSLALKSNGTVWSWGSNIYGQLGNGTTTNTTIPVQVLVLTGATAISAGGWNSAALKKDGTVWTWGWNTDGQLGDGTFTDKIVPVQVPGLTGIIAISAGTYHILALKSDSTVWAWGDNISGQIGDGTTIDRNTPIQISSLTGVTAIATGRFFSLAVKSDGTVWTWGENLYGQLGNGTTTDNHIPVKVSGLTGIIKAATCGAFECHVIKNDGTVWAWGRNTYGNLGDGSITHKLTPVQMTGISDVAGLAAGTNFSLLYKNDGTFWGCGRNASGQLGDGTFLQRNTLVQATSLCPIMHPTGIFTYDIINKPDIKAYPNPSTTGIFTLNITPTSEMANQPTCGKLEIINILGEKVLHLTMKQQMFDSPLIIDLSDQPSGLYFINFKFGTFSFNHKLIKQ